MNYEKPRQHLEDIIDNPGMKFDIAPEVMAVLRELDRLGFEIKAIAPNGSYFEVINRKEWRGEMWAASRNPGGES